jgi:hypothetical protein
MKKKFLIILNLCVAIGLVSVTIYDVQYTTVPGTDNTYPSLYNGQEVTVTGIVVGTGFTGYEDNYYIAMPGGGPWSGIYVYKANFFNTTNPVVAVGDEVEVTGYVSEYYGFTEISGNSNPVTVTLLSSGNPVPNPVVVQTSQLVEPANAEQYEGCFVEVQNVVVTSEQNNYGEWYVTDTSAVPCQVDDGFFYLDSVTPPIVITLGMEWAIIRGCLDYSYSEYAINPRTPDDLIDEVSAPQNVVSTVNEFLGCYPNPFNPETTAYLSLVKESHLKMNIFNIKGEKIRKLIDETLPAGNHHIRWDGTDDLQRNVASGVYFVVAESNDNDFTSVKKVILLK